MQFVGGMHILRLCETPHVKIICSRQTNQLLAYMMPLVLTFLLLLMRHASESITNSKRIGLS